MKELTNKTKLIWILAIGAILLSLAVIVWAYQRNNLEITANEYVPISSPTPTPLPTVIEDTCSLQCQTNNYQEGTCRSYSITPEGLDNQCASDEISIGETADCFVEPGILGAGKTCCCSSPLEDAVEPTPTLTSTPTSAIDLTPTPTPTFSSSPDSFTLISTGASLWFNLSIALLLTLSVAYLVFRTEIWHKK